MGSPPSTVVAIRTVRLCEVDALEGAEGKKVLLLLMVGLGDREGLIVVEGLIEGAGDSSDRANKRG